MRRSLIALCLAMAMSGCTAGPPPDAKTIKIEVTGQAGKVTGSVRASDPGQAGVSLRSFEINVPGNIEFKGGTSEYTLTMDSLPQKDKLIISVDGTALKPGIDMVYEADKGPRVTFNIDTKKGTDNKKK